MTGEAGHAAGAPSVRRVLAPFVPVRGLLIRVRHPTPAQAGFISIIRCHTIFCIWIYPVYGFYFHDQIENAA